MAGSTLKQESCKELSKLFAQLSGAIGETVGSLIGRKLGLRPIDTLVVESEALLASLQKSYIAARGALDKSFAGKSMTVLFEVQDAVAMSGMLMMTPDDVLQQRRAKGALEGEDAEAFGELGNVLFSGIGNTLREHVKDVDVRMERHAAVKAGDDSEEALPTGTLVAQVFAMQVGEYPETKAYILTDIATAEVWNKGPLGHTDANSQAATGKPSGSSRFDDDGCDAIPMAPIRGTLAAFVCQPEVYRTLRQSCRRVGLDLRRHGKGEIPNPAAHRQEIVLVDVPPGDERQFEWCRRIKEFAAETKVVLLLHHPSRSRVTQAFLSKADVILGFPCAEAQLSQKLGLMLEAKPPEPAE